MFLPRQPVKGSLFIVGCLGWLLAPTETRRGWLLAALILMATRPARAQDALRNSLAGDAAAEALRQQQTSQQNYTYKAGDFKLLATPSLEMDWNDNINLAKTNVESDFIVYPSLQLTGSYPVTQRNLLRLSVGIGYYDYLQHSTNSGLRVASDSLLSFDMFIKDFLINFHDRFSLTEDSSTEPSVTGTALYGIFNNTAGLTTTWDLEDLVLTAGYDHLNSLSASGQFSYLDRSSESLLGRAGIYFRPDLTAGVEVSASFNTYEQEVLNNSESYSGGVYADWKPSPALRVQPRVGYTIYQFQQTSQSDQIYYFGSPAPAASEPIRTQDLNSWYADLTVTHQLSKAINYGFSAGHEIQLGIESDVVEDYYFRPNVTWTIIKNVGLNTSLFFEHGNQGVGNEQGNVVETFNWLGGGLTVTYPLMKRLTLGLTYRLTYRSSSISANEYLQNLVGLRLAYQLP